MQRKPATLSGSLREISLDFISSHPIIGDARVRTKPVCLEVPSVLRLGSEG
jgi:hypothetical protein